MSEKTPLSAIQNMVKSMPPVEKEKKKIKRSKKHEEGQPSSKSTKTETTTTTTTAPLTVVEEPLQISTTETFLPPLEFETEQAMVNLLDSMITTPTMPLQIITSPPPIIPAPRMTMGEIKQYNINVCPFHNENLAAFQAESNGETYVKCSRTPCRLFTHSKDVVSYMNVIHSKVHEIYKKMQGAVKCECNSQASLKVSRSQKNPERPFFTCRENGGCRFFQWADVPFKFKNQELQAKFA